MNNKAIMNYEYSTEFENFITDNIGEIENIVHEMNGNFVGTGRKGIVSHGNKCIRRFSGYI